ncbi:MAG: hypothetical protein HY558_04010, partial [Euryarchaeota archaeon]|nr:hypothetical protein [Euryarchaeota archaeon]
MAAFRVGGWLLGLAVLSLLLRGAVEVEAQGGPLFSLQTTLASVDLRRGEEANFSVQVTSHLPRGQRVRLEVVGAAREWVSLPGEVEIGPLGVARVEGRVA